jgi:ribosome-binding factor A
MTRAVARTGQHRGFRRSERVGAAIREVLAEAIERLVDDPHMGLITITAVDVAPDLKSARVYVSVLGAPPEPALAALTETAPALQREIASHVRLMWTPRLAFVADTTAERAFRIDRLLNEDEGA